MKKNQIAANAFLFCGVALHAPHAMPRVRYFYAWMFLLTREYSRKDQDQGLRYVLSAVEHRMEAAEKKIYEVLASLKKGRKAGR